MTEKYTREELLEMSHEQLAEVARIAIEMNGAVEESYQRLHQQQEIYKRQLFQFALDRAISVLNLDKSKDHTWGDVLELSKTIESYGQLRMDGIHAD